MTDGQNEAEIEQVARMLARGLGHNDELGMYWDRYLAPARIVVREFRAISEPKGSWVTYETTERAPRTVEIDPDGIEDMPETTETVAEAAAGLLRTSRHAPG